MKENLFNDKHNITSERIRIARERKGLTQMQLAAKVQTEGLVFSNNILCQIEGNARLVRDYELKFIAKHLGVSADWLLGEGSL